MLQLKKVYLVIVVVTFAFGVAFGVLTEKDYGVRNIFKIIGFSDRGELSSPTVETLEGIIPETYQGKLQLFVLAGQSNMSGLGDIPQEEAPTHPQIFVFGNDYHWKLAKEPVDNPSDQVDAVSIDVDAAFGPSVSFATTLLEQRPDAVIGLIPCAKGGSLIYDWRRQLNDSTLYGSCLKRVRAASVMGNVAGFLFFQGEIDTVDPGEDPERTFLPDRWADEFVTQVNHWRNDLDLPELPVVFAQIGTNTEPDRFKKWALVQAQQRQVQLPFAVMITTDDLALRDYVHFTTESYQTIGQRFAKAYLGLASVTP